MEHELFWGPNSEISQSWEDMHNLYFSSYFDMVDAFFPLNLLFNYFQ